MREAVVAPGKSQRGGQVGEFLADALRLTALAIAITASQTSWGSFFCSVITAPPCDPKTPGLNSRPLAEGRRMTRGGVASRSVAAYRVSAAS